MEPGSFMIEPEGNGVCAKWYGKEEERLTLGGEPIYKGKRYERDWIDALRCHECNAVTLFLPRLIPRPMKKSSRHALHFEPFIFLRGRSI